MTAWGNLGNVLKSQSKMAEAEQAYRNALYHRSNMADMLYNLWVSFWLFGVWTCQSVFKQLDKLTNSPFHACITRSELFSFLFCSSSWYCLSLSHSKNSMSLFFLAESYYYNIQYYIKWAYQDCASFKAMKPLTIFGLEKLCSFRLQSKQL